VVERLRSEIPLREAKALDIGAGSGGLAIAIAKAGGSVVAIEPDSRRRRWAEARVRGHRVDVRVVDGSGEQINYPDASFDLVTLDSVIEHVDDPACVIGEVSRVLCPGGLVYLVSPNKSSLISILSDPHYEMFGVVLMPRWLGKFYVERIRRVRRGYWVNLIPTKRWLKKRFCETGLRFQQLDPEGFEKLETPRLIRHPIVRGCAIAANRLHLTSVLHRILLSQYPAFVVLGRKEPS
jgi:SAM-dependent methyltransferase